MSTTETKVRHSPLPWRFDGSVTIDADSKAVLSVPASHDLRTVNREFMLRAVNSHADMLEALEKAQDTLEWIAADSAPGWSITGDAARTILPHIQSVIRKAKGGAA